MFTILTAKIIFTFGFDTFAALLFGVTNGAEELMLGVKLDTVTLLSSLRVAVTHESLGAV